MSLLKPPPPPLKNPAYATAQVNPNQTLTAKVFWAGAKPEPEPLFDENWYRGAFVKNLGK